MARFAVLEDADEIVRLARVMFESMGISADGWEAEGRDHVRRRLGEDLAVFVVDAPSGGLAASAAGTIAQRLPTPFNVAGTAGYVQWVCTDPSFRGQGLARQVMRALLDWYADAGVRSVELHSTPMAVTLYQSLGFSDDGPRALRRVRSPDPAPR